MNRGTNSNLMKESNKKLVLNLIRQSEFSRADISRETGLTKAAVTIIADELIKNNIVFENEPLPQGVGRRPVKLSINYNSFYAVGINISRSKYNVGIINLNGDVLISESGRTENPEILIKKLNKIVENQIKSLNIEEENLLGIGITTPGPVNYKENKILCPPNFRQWHNISIKESDFILPVSLENVANAYALSEKYFGVCQKDDNYLLLLVDEGVGSGIIVEGKIYRGNKGLGNELGHNSIDYRGLACECGNCGCLEMYASIPNILAGTLHESWNAVVDKNDVAIMKKEAEYLASGLTNALNLFDFDKIIIAGDIAYKPKMLIKRLKGLINERVITKTDIEIKVSPEQNNIKIAGSIIINTFYL